MVIFRHFNLVIDFCISARYSINNHFFTRCPLTKNSIYKLVFIDSF